MMPTSPSSPRRRKLSYNKLRGITLVELMVTVTVAGVLATAASVSFNEQINKSRSVEAVSMLGTMQKAASLTGVESMGTGSDLDFTRTTFGNADGGIDGDGNNGHGNNADGCDPDNPAGCKGDKDKDKDDNGNGNAVANANGGGIDGDGNNGHGNNPDGCDPDNPAGCKGKGGDDPSDGSGSSNPPGDGSSGDGSGSSNPPGDSSSGDGSGSGGPGDGSSGSDTGGGNDGSGSGSDGSGSGSGPTGGTGPSSDGIQSLCGSADPVPGSIGQVSGKVYNAPPTEWASGSPGSGWSCLKVNRAGPQRYQYGYDKGPGTIEGASEGYTAWARGDLDGDGRTSLFRVRGNLVDGKVVSGFGVEVIDGTE